MRKNKPLIDSVTNAGIPRLRNERAAGQPDPTP